MPNSALHKYSDSANEVPTIAIWLYINPFPTSVLLNGISIITTFGSPFVYSFPNRGKRFYVYEGFIFLHTEKVSVTLAPRNPLLVGKGCNDTLNQFCSFEIPIFIFHVHFILENVLTQGTSGG